LINLKKGKEGYMQFKKHIPNFVTSLNLFSGSIGVAAIFGGHTTAAVILMGAAAIFDFADGLVARALHVKSAIGKELDSLADVVSFGLLPGAIMYQLMLSCSNLPGKEPGWMNPYPYIAFLIPVFSALRLAKFNIDTRQSDSFIGLPTPANALLIASLPMIVLQVGESGQKLIPIASLLNNYFFLAGLTLVMSWLLVAEIPLFALKFQNYRWEDNKSQFTFIGFSILLLVILHFMAIPVIILMFILMSVLRRKAKNKIGPQ
jgi:CDP-diacylglycerol---serine O-phosphatidyltransferase